MNISKYEHNGAVVSVIDTVKGHHREHCLCWQGCKFFHPNTPENCPIAQSLITICRVHDVTTPVYECATFEPKDGEG